MGLQGECRLDPVRLGSNAGLSRLKRDDVKSARPVLPPGLACQKIPGAADNLLLLVYIHRFRRRAIGSSGAESHFHEDKVSVQQRDDINFAATTAKVPHHNVCASIDQQLYCLLFRPGA